MPLTTIYGKPLIQRVVPRHTIQRAIMSSRKGIVFAGAITPLQTPMVSEDCVHTAGS